MLKSVNGVLANLRLWNKDLKVFAKKTGPATLAVNAASGKVYTSVDATDIPMPLGRTLEIGSLEPDDIYREITAASDCNDADVVTALEATLDDSPPELIP